MLAKRLNPFPVQAPYNKIYAHGTEIPAAARTVYVSGQYGISKDGIVPKDFRSQCKNTITNIQSVLESASMTLRDIVKMNIYLIRPEDMSTLVDVRKEMLSGIAPAITTVFVAGLVGENWLVEIDVVAAAI